MEAQKNKKKGLKMIKISTYRVIICLMVIALTGGMLALAPSLVTPVMADEGTGMDNPWLTFLGGYRWDEGRGIAVDADGNIYVTGSSYDSWGTPVRAHSRGHDCFVAKLSSDGILLWNTFLGGSNNNEGRGIAVDASGNVYVTGTSHNSWGEPVRDYTPSGMPAPYGDAFVAKLSGDGRLLWNTFLGGNNTDEGLGIEVDASGNVYVTGGSDASWGSPVRAHSGGGQYDAFVAKLGSNGVLQWNTFLGGNNTDEGLGIEVDASGNVYVTGESYNSWGTPVRAYSGGYDSFVAKLGSDGVLQWNTFLGSNSTDIGWDIAVDTGGNVYVTGESYKRWSEPVRAHSGGYGDAFVVKLGSNGELQWNTFLGSSADDFGYGIAVDVGGNIYVTGRSGGSWGTLVRDYSGGGDSFVAKLGSDGILLWNTFLGGNSNDEGRGIAVDTDGNIYVTGSSYDSWGTPVRAHSGYIDAFVVRLNSKGELESTGPKIHVRANGVSIANGDVTPSLTDHTDFGGIDIATGTVVRTFTIENNGYADLILTGNPRIGITGVNAADFSVTVQPVSPVAAGSSTTFTVTFDPSTIGLKTATISITNNDCNKNIYTFAIQGTGIIPDNPWLTFLGGNSNDEGRGIAVDTDGNVYVTGRSLDSWGKPVRAHSGGGESFVAKLSSNGVLQWNTFLAGNVRDEGRGFAVDASGNIYVTGISNESWGTPVRAHSGGYYTDAFVAKFNSDGVLQWNTFLGGNSNDEGRGIVVDASGNIYVTGGSDASWGSPVRAYLGNTDSFVAKLGSDGGLLWNTFLGGNGDDLGYGIAVDASGNIYVTGRSGGSWGTLVRDYSGGGDSFVAKLGSNGALLWNTFLGGSGYDHGAGIAVDAGGNVYVTGYSKDSWGTPLRVHSGGSDAFVVKLNSSGELESTVPKINLTISKSGTGSGTVTSNPAGINCGSTCSATFPKDTTINLTATPAEGSVFVGWAGDCTGAGTNLVCALTMDASKNVTARFDSKTPTYVIELLRGWNFISLPVEPSDTSITAVLKDISSSVRIVWGYDNQNKTWKRFRPGGENNNLGDMMMNKGYWIYMNTPETLIIEGQPSDPQAVTLYKGWNLTGYNGQDNKDVSQALESVAGRWTLIWNWDNGGWYARHESDLELSVAPLGALNLKKAYWILMKEAGEWQQ